MCYELGFVVFFHKSLYQGSQNHDLMLVVGATPLYNAFIVSENFPISREGSWVLFHIEVVLLLFTLDGPFI
jgi:hypothetical protein